MPPFFLAITLASPAHAALPLVVDASSDPVELQAVVEGGVLDLEIAGERLSEWDDVLAIVNATGAALPLTVLDAVDTDGTTWTVQVTAYAKRTSTTWERDTDGAWTEVDGSVSWSLVVTAAPQASGTSGSSGTSKPPVVTYGPVITIKPKG